MFELIESTPVCEVPAAEYQRLLGYPRHHSLEGRASKLVETSRRWFSENGRPWIYARATGPLELPAGLVRIGETDFFSPRLHALFAAASAQDAIVVAVSAGKECEEHARDLWQTGRPDEFFFLKVFGSAVVEQLLTVVAGRLCAWAEANQMAVLPHCSPGYSGWDVAEQAKLWRLCRSGMKGSFPGELEVMESGMLRPEKSLLGLFGLTRNLDKARRFERLIPCQCCSLAHCQFRRALHKNSWTRIGLLDG